MENIEVTQQIKQLVDELYRRLPEIEKVMVCPDVGVVSLKRQYMDYLIHVSPFWGIHEKESDFDNHINIQLVGEILPKYGLTELDRRQYMPFDWDLNYLNDNGVDDYIDYYQRVLLKNATEIAHHYISKELKNKNNTKYQDFEIFNIWHDEKTNKQ